MNNEYSADAIEVLEGLEAVRRRPRMYLGAIGSEGLSRLVRSALVDTAGDPADGVSAIELVLGADGRVTLRNDGRGVPIARHRRTGATALELFFTVMGRGRVDDPTWWRPLGNALSEELVVYTTVAGRRYRQRFVRGYDKSELEDLGATRERGTEIVFRPESSFFGEGLPLDTVALRADVDALAALRPRLEITVDDRRIGASSRYCVRHPGGLGDLARAIAEAPASDEAITFSLHETGDENSYGGTPHVDIDVAIQPTRGRRVLVRGYAGLERQDGSHVVALERVALLGGAVVLIAIRSSCPFDRHPDGTLDADWLEPAITEAACDGVSVWASAHPEQALAWITSAPA